jgi:cobalamin biosynthesis Mg chelatase CobN
VLHPDWMAQCQCSGISVLWLCAGLYKQLSELQNLLSEYRESPAENESLRAPIIDMLATSGLDQDCPYSDREELTGDNVEAVAAADFSAYADRLYRCARPSSRHHDSDL